MSATVLALRRRLLVVPTLDGLWALVAVAVPTAGAFASRMMAIDLAYQIRAGAVMLDTHRLLDADIFTFTVHGRPWLNQQWGAQVLLATIFRIGGWDGIALARGLLLGLILFVVYRTCRAAGAAPRTAALLTLAGWVVGIEIVPSMRPQLFGFLFFTLVLWLVTTRHATSNRIWWIPALVMPWANMHGSFPLAFVLLGIAWIQDHRSDPVFGKKLLLVGAAALLASLVNPFGAEVWPYAMNLLTNPVVLRQIAEWGPPSIHSPTGLFFFVSLFAVVVLLARRSSALGWVPLLTLAFFAAVSLLAIRGVAWWALGAPVIVAGIIGDDARHRAGTRPPLHLLFATAVLIVTFATIPFSRGRDPAGGGPAVLTYAPESLLAAARGASPAETNAFVSQLYASWAEFSAPMFLVAVDPRIEVFPAPVWSDYFLVSSGREGWDDVLDRWDVRLLILEPGQAEGLLQVLPEHAEWRLVARNPSGAVYERS